ncbi:MAG: ligase [Burkholderiaceae bacterium]|nr:ligase [Burkholderiaceae bacterium]
MRAEATIADEHAWVAEALAAPVERAQWRVWRYPAAEIVLGCSQRALHAEVGRRAAPGIDVSVRPSGGGAVLAGPWMIGVSVVLAPDDPLLGESLVASYRWLGELHVRLMRETGIEARAVEPQRLREAGLAPGAATLRWACFGALSPWEVVDAAGRKLTGLAQQRRRTGVALSAGTLVSRPDWRLLCDALGAPDDAAQLDRLTAACDEAPGADRLGPDDWAQAIDAALGRLLG